MKQLFTDAYFYSKIMFFGSTKYRWVTKSISSKKIYLFHGCGTAISIYITGKYQKTRHFTGKRSTDLLINNRIETGQPIFHNVRNKFNMIIYSKSKCKFDFLENLSGFWMTNRKGFKKLIETSVKIKLPYWFRKKNGK